MERDECSTVQDTKRVGAWISGGLECVALQRTKVILQLVFTYCLTLITTQPHPPRPSPAARQSLLLLLASNDCANRPC